MNETPKSQPCQKLVYEQTCEDFRSLNDIMWRVPIMVMTLTGGLGVAIATFDLSDPARRAISIFAAVINIAFIGVLIRLRIVMQKLLQRIHAYQGTTSGNGFIVVGIFSLMLAVAASGSLYFAWNADDVFRTEAEADVTTSQAPSKP